MTTQDLNAWSASVGPRLTLQADLTWTGGQDGYAQAGQQDGANPYGQIWWVLEPRAEHCSDCPVLAANSPYDAPWVIGGNTLNVSPGDGSTECGASCKCSLSYDPPAGQPNVVPPPSVPQWMPADAPEMAEPPQSAPYTPAPPATPPAPSQPQIGPSGPYGPALPPGGFTSEQKAALDLYRLAELSWNQVRGSYQPLPNFFQLARPDLEWEVFRWDDLTPEQQHALEMAFQAYVQWTQATMPDVANDQGLSESDDERGMLLYGVNRLPAGMPGGGRYTYGGLGHAVSGGGSHGASQHAGAGHVAEHVGGAMAGGGGGGGGGGAATATKPAAAATAKPKAPRKPRAPKPKPIPLRAAPKTIPLPKTPAELKQEADDRLAAAKVEEASAKKALDTAKRSYARAQIRNATRIATLQATFRAAQTAHANAYPEAREALITEAADAKAASGKAPVTSAKYLASKAPWQAAVAAHDTAVQAERDARQAKDDLFKQYASDPKYMYRPQDYGYNAAAHAAGTNFNPTRMTRLQSDHPDYVAAEAAHLAASRAESLARGTLRAKEATYIKLRDQLGGASKITPAQINAHPSIVAKAAAKAAAEKAYDKATNNDKVKAAQTRYDAAKAELSSAQAAVTHPTWKYPTTNNAITRAKYTDLSQWSTHDLEKAASHVTSSAMNKRTGDLAMQNLQDAQGFRDKPQIVTEDQLKADIQSGAKEWWRGDTALSHTDEFMLGNYHAGLGIRGSGTYAATGAQGYVEAKGYAQQVTYNYSHQPHIVATGGMVMRGALRSGARTITAVSLTQALRAARQQNAADLQAARQSGDQNEIRRQTAIKTLLHGTNGNNFGGPNLSLFGTLMGYDAMLAPSAGHVIIYNRGALQISNQLRHYSEV